MKVFKSPIDVLFQIFLIMIFTISVFSMQNKLLTVAESSGYTATVRYDEVMHFIHTLQGISNQIRIETICTSAEGREVPLLVIGNPVPNSPSDLIFEDKAVVYIQANIHAGEVEGKEASLMLARDILLKEDTEYLDKLIILIAPIFNADGNEKISKKNRTNQVGPEQGPCLSHPLQAQPGARSDHLHQADPRGDHQDLHPVRRAGDDPVEGGPEHGHHHLAPGGEQGGAAAGLRGVSLRDRFGL